MCAFVAVHAGAGTHPHKTEDVCLKAVCKSKGDIVEAVKVWIFTINSVLSFPKEYNSLFSLSFTIFIHKTKT